MPLNRANRPAGAVLRMTGRNSRNRPGLAAVSISINPITWLGTATSAKKCPEF